MPVHNWTKVEAGIFHHFHHEWISEIARTLNRGLLPPNYYALIWHHAKSETDVYAGKAKVVAIRHTSNHRLVAVAEIVSPGNKSHRQAIAAFVAKALALLRAGVHLLIVDLFPPSARDPGGIHKAVFTANDFVLPGGKPLTLASYIGGVAPEAFIERTAVGASLPNVPLFLTADDYVPVPLEASYEAAWEAVPSYWRGVVVTST